MKSRVPRLKSLFPTVAAFSVIGAATASLLGLVTSSSMAGTKTATMAVTATVVQDCMISASPMAFGSYDPTSATGITGSGALSVTCTKNSSGVTVTLASANGFNMKDSASNSLPYAVSAPSGGISATCPASASGTPTGNSFGSVSLSPTSVKTPLTVNVCGQINAGNDVPPGTSYSDTITATVNF